MARYKDLTGLRFGNLVAIKRCGINNQNRAMWLCKCDCGNEKLISSHDLKHSTISCGCIGAIKRLENLKRGRAWNKGLKMTYKYKRKERVDKCSPEERRIRKIYYHMKQRCYNTNNDRYKDYGGRGIKICEEWLKDIKHFVKWSLDNNYKNSLTIDRIDNNGNYEPYNCRWVTKKTQANNTRRNHNITFNGEIKTLTEWAKELNVKPSCIATRIARGWTIEESLFGRKQIL